MADSVGLPADMFVPELALDYLSYEFKDNLGVLNRFMGAGAQYPISLRNFGLLRGGQYVEQPRFKKIASLVQRRVYSSVSDPDTLKMESKNERGVKICLRVGPLAMTPDQARLAGLSTGALEQEFASQMAQAVRAKIRDLFLIAAKAVIQGMTTAAHTHSVYETNDADNSAILKTALLSRALQATMKDRGDRITGWITRPEPFGDLVGAQVATTASGIAERTGDGGAPYTLGKPIEEVESATLVEDGGTNNDKWDTLGIGPGFCELEFMAPPVIYAPVFRLDVEPVQIILRADMDLLLRFTGMQWDVANGGANPDDTNLGTSSNWDPAYSDHKDVAGILIEHNSTVS